VVRYVDGSRVDDQARRELDLIKAIHEHGTAKTEATYLRSLSAR
jgi:hypothetical protein